MKKLTKSSDKKICGVCGGIAEYLNIDPTVVRIIWLLLIFFAGLDIIIYIIAALIMPEADGSKFHRNRDNKDDFFNLRESNHSSDTSESRRSNNDFDKFFEK